MKASPLGVAKRGALSVLGRIAALGIVVAIAGGCEAGYEMPVATRMTPADSAAAVGGIRITRIQVGVCWYVLARETNYGGVSVTHAGDCPNHYHGETGVRVEPRRAK